MYEINRSLMVVIPKRPFWFWLQSFEELGISEFTLEDLQEDANTYLIDPCDDLDDLWNIVEERMSEIFSAELADWNEDTSTWPDLHIDIFTEWFDVKLSTVVTDLSHEELEREEFEPFTLGD